MRVRSSVLFLMFCSSVFAAPCETKRQVFIENAETKVWKTTICPQQKLPFHTHQYPRVVIADENGSLNVVYQSGKEKVIHLKKQIPILLDAAQGSSPHQDINLGKRPLHVMVIELKH